MSKPYDGVCPDCGRVFSLPDLKRMAMAYGPHRQRHRQHQVVVLP